MRQKTPDLVREFMIKIAHLALIGLLLVGPLAASGDSAAPSVGYRLIELSFGGSSWGINASGQVVGDLPLSLGGLSHAFLYSRGSTIDLGTLGGVQSSALSTTPAKSSDGRQQPPRTYAPSYTETAP